MIPVFYDHANAWKSSVAPCAVQPSDNRVFNYYMRYLLKRAISLFKWTVPETWDLDFMLYTLYCNGVTAIIRTSQFGVIPQWGEPSGYDVFYRPTRVIVDNPVFSARDNKEYTLQGNNPDAVLIKLQPDYSSILDICGMYAFRLSYIHEALYMNLTNSKLAYVFLTDNKATAETFKKVFDQIQRGDPVAVAGNKLKGEDGKPLWDLFTNNLKQNYLAADLLDNMRAVLNDFDSFIGIPSANTTKKERLVSDEVNANNVETETLIDLMEQTINECLDKVNSVFGLSLSIERRYKDENNNSVDVPLQPESV